MYERDLYDLAKGLEEVQPESGGCVNRAIRFSDSSEDRMIRSVRVLIYCHPASLSGLKVRIAEDLSLTPRSRDWGKLEHQVHLSLRINVSCHVNEFHFTDTNLSMVLPGLLHC